MSIVCVPSVQMASVRVAAESAWRAGGWGAEEGAAGAPGAAAETAGGAETAASAAGTAAEPPPPQPLSRSWARPEVETGWPAAEGSAGSAASGPAAGGPGVERTSEINTDYKL